MDIKDGLSTLATIEVLSEKNLKNGISLIDYLMN